ncbi:MAG: class II glutamine amidotransferase [Nitrososphaerales archaeon]
MLAIFPENNTVVDASIVRSFRNLASCGMTPPSSKPGHSDGWGVLSWLNGTPNYLGREPTDATSDPRYEEACKGIEKSKTCSPIIAHLRKASVGLKIRENTHPFVFKEWGFAHNGTIRKLNMKTTTDSQWFFECLMKEYELGRDMLGAITKLVKHVQDVYDYTSITFVLSNGYTMYIYRDCRKSPKYYGMFFTEKGNQFVASQEKFFDSNWTELRNGELLIRENGRSKIVKISEPLLLNA